MKYGLNDEQWAAVIAPSPSYVNASAGAGKTRCLTAKIQYLVDTGVSPSSICAITFTNKAANEMKERLKKNVDVSDMQISTIHSMSVKIIKSYLKHTRLKVPFTIYDGSDQLSIIKTIMKSRELPGEYFDVQTEISQCKATDTVPKDPIFLEIYEQYQEILKTNNACDFDDLLVFARDCLKDPLCHDYYSRKWRHILVDEVQDTSKIQYEIITRIYDLQFTRTLFMVGDTSQSIYGWRNARPENITDFIKNYNATSCYLTYNYRSRPEIIRLANKFQQFGKPMVAKTDAGGKISCSIFSSIEDEAEQIAKALKSAGGYSDTAIIYRVNTRSLYFEQAFARYQIPYKVVNDLAFFQRRVSKDMIAALKASNNNMDRESLARIINNPKRGFGDAKKEKLLLQGRPYIEGIMEDMPLIKSFMKLLDEIKGMTPAAALSKYIHQSGYRLSLTKDSDFYMLTAIQDVVAKFDSVEDLILASSFMEKDSSNGVNLITAHGSKGLEYDRVFVVGMEDGLWPHKNTLDIEEEKRLFYVACTRAKRCLNISYSRSKSFKGVAISTEPSDIFKETYGILYDKP